MKTATVIQCDNCHHYGHNRKGPFCKLNGATMQPWEFCNAFDAMPKIWCAMCGKMTNHGSGACPQLADSRPERDLSSSEDDTKL